MEFRHLLCRQLKLTAIDAGCKHYRLTDMPIVKPTFLMRYKILLTGKALSGALNMADFYGAKAPGFTNYSL
jgi:hypothetical protein